MRFLSERLPRIPAVAEGQGEEEEEEEEGEKEGGDGEGSVKSRQLNDSGRCRLRTEHCPAMEGREDAECEAAFAEARRWLEVRR